MTCEYYFCFCWQHAQDHPVVVHVEGWDERHVYCIFITIIEIAMHQSKMMLRQHCVYSHDQQ